MTNENEQWELNGDCSKCRRKNYCSKPCTRHKRKTTAMVQGMIFSELNEMSGGAFKEILKNKEY